MSKIQSAADEIIKDVEKIIAGYEEEMFQSKREISRQRKMLNAPKPEIKLNTITERLPIEADEDTKMSKIEGLRVLVKHFLSVAADRIVEAVEKMIADYEGEMHQSKRDISRQSKMLHVLLQPEITLTRTPEEAQLNLSVWEEDFLNSSPRQKNPESLQTEKSHKDKVEEEPLPVPSPGFSEPENGDDDDWNATQDGDSDRSEEWSNSGQHRTLTAKKRTKKNLKSRTEKKLQSCKVCGKSFHYEGSFVKHLKGHPKDSCGLCGMHFKTEEDLIVHMETHKTVKTSKVLACDVCGKCFAKTSNLKMHMRSHTEEPLPVPSPGFPEPENGDDDDLNATQDRDSDRSDEWTPSTLTKKNSCKLCGKSFHYEGASLVKHLKSHPKDECGLCGMHFETEEDFKLHVETHKTVNVVVCETPQKKKNSCKLCGKSFQYEASLVKHLKSHPKDECGLCGMHFKTEEDFNLHVETHKTVKVVVCDFCGKCFADSSNLKVHMRSHTGERPYMCEVCGKAFVSRPKLTQHFRTHTGDKPFECEVCGKRFAFRPGMTQHLRIHTGEKPFRCEVCGKSFNKQSTLARHHMIHTGDTQYSCTICSEHFISYSTLRKHMRTHSKCKNITATPPVSDARDVNVEMEDSTALMMIKEQQIICKVCGKDFHSKFSLVKHLESHPKDDCGLCGMHFNTEEDFEIHLKTHIATVCEVCGKCFAKNPFYLEKHMMTHMGEKPFKCTQCGKSFRRRWNLADHLRIHTGEKPYSCVTCGKRFKTDSNLKQHMRVVKHFASATL